MTLLRIGIKKRTSRVRFLKNYFTKAQLRVAVKKI